MIMLNIAKESFQPDFSLFLAINEIETEGVCP